MKENCRGFIAGEKWGDSLAAVGGSEKEHEVGMGVGPVVSWSRPPAPPCQTRWLAARQISTSYKPSFRFDAAPMAPRCGCLSLRRSG